MGRRITHCWTRPGTANITNPDRCGKNQAYTEDEIGWFRDGSKLWLYPNTLTGRILYSTNTPTYLPPQHSLTFSGSVQWQDVRFFSSVGYLFDDNLINTPLGVSSDRYNFSVNVQSDPIQQWLTLKTDAIHSECFWYKDEHLGLARPCLGAFLLWLAVPVNGEWGSIAEVEKDTQRLWITAIHTTCFTNSGVKSQTQRNIIYDLWILVLTEAD